MADKMILVAGATGAQNGAVIDAVLEKGMAARALVRDPASPHSQALSARAFELAQGDFDGEIRTGDKLIATARTGSVSLYDG